MAWKVAVILSQQLSYPPCFYVNRVDLTIYGYSQSSWCQCQLVSILQRHQILCSRLKYGQCIEQSRTGHFYHAAYTNQRPCKRMLEHHNKESHSQPQKYPSHSKTKTRCRSSSTPPNMGPESYHRSQEPKDLAGDYILLALILASLGNMCSPRRRHYADNSQSLMNVKPVVRLCV